MFDLLPVIWINKGKCVLQQGNFMTKEVLSHNPLELAHVFARHGMSKLHLVDLEGAKKSKPKNYHVLETVAAHTNLKIGFSARILQMKMSTVPLNTVLTRLPPLL